MLNYSSTNVQESIYTLTTKDYVSEVSQQRGNTAGEPTAADSRLGNGRLN